MRIFFSHNSRDKPLLREIKNYFPNYIPIWMDEDKIIAGEDLFMKIKKEITINSDLIVFFFSIEALSSKWVLREVRWALEQEKNINRLFILPVILDEECKDKLPSEFMYRKYLTCTNFTTSEVQKFSALLYNELFEMTLKILDNRSEDVFIKNQKYTHNKIKKIFQDEETIKNFTLNKKALKTIINKLDIKNKILLLLLYEFKFGHFKDPWFFETLNNVIHTKVHINNNKINSWQFLVKYPRESSDFNELRYEYGFGDVKYIVKGEIIFALTKLAQNEFSKLFNDIHIENLSSEKLFDVVKS
ncbi:MAG: toll/interleukin-1 receptor domain-containing protein [Ignavibacteria bacterium]|jgi:hypothetical protein